jgi:phage portal protein BeeE
LEAIARAAQLIELAQQRLEEIARMLGEIEITEQGIQQAKITGQGMQQPEIFSRYQQSLNREIYDAIEQLEAIQQRKNKSSMGSFGHDQKPKGN